MKKTAMLMICLLFIAGLFINSFGQELNAYSVSPDSIDPQKTYWDDVNGFLDRQAQFSLGLVEQVLYHFPPGFPETLERKMALAMIDCVLHDESAPLRPPVQKFYHSRMTIALEEIERSKIENGATIWKLYDHGFIIRTSTVTIAFDLIRGYSSGADGFPVSDDIMRKIVNQCDVLFISHRHKDHADETVAKFFLDQDKPVIAPNEVWHGKPIHQRITHIKPDPHKLQKIPIIGGTLTLNAVIYPGHQGENIQNNVSLVFTPEGLSFCHTGDQANSEDFTWIDQVKDNYKVDVLMPNCWTTDIDRMSRGFNAKVIITGHENELGHSIDHREPYWLTYDRLHNTSCPLLLMTWGESFHYNVQE